MPKHIQEAPWTKEDLVQWNRKAIQWMVYQSDPQNAYPVSKETATYGRKSGMDMIESRLKEKQQDLNLMLHKPTPEPIDFKLCEVDEPIANMEELVKQQLREREMILLEPSNPPTETLAGQNTSLLPKQVSFVDPEPVNIVLTKEEEELTPPPIPISPPSVLETSVDELRRELATIKQQLQWCLEFPGIKRWLDAKNAK